MKFNKKTKTINLSPPSLLALGFLGFIALGTLLLKLPIAYHHNLSWLEALFTATSAVTITGLSVVPIYETYTLFGQFIILFLIQIGGLGFITFAVLAALSLSPQMGLKQQLFAQNAMGETSLNNITRVATAVLIYTLFFELLGFIILFFSWYPNYGFARSAFYALFYSVSAFNNAGFSLYTNSLIPFQQQLTIFIALSCLYIVGGIGFVVLIDIKRNKKWKKLSPNSKLVISGVLVLNIIAFMLIWMLEAKNPNTLGNMPISQQITHAWFHATVPRSSGFNSISLEEMTNASTFLTMVLMFIGGGSLSTAGGIKIGTFIILVLSVISFLKRQDEIIVFKHSIPHSQIFKALAVTAITCMFILIGIFILLILEPKKNIIDIIFEVISASCTVGLSRGITNNLHPYSSLVLIFLMYAGRLGPITLIYLIATPAKSRLKHPSSEIQIG